MSLIRITGNNTAICLAILGALAQSARADFFRIPNGNPTGAASASGPQGTSTLNPSPAIGMLAGNCPWLEPALAAQGFKAAGRDGVPGNADDWAIQYRHLAGTITLQTYFAWYGTQPGSPDYTCGDLNAFGPRGNANSGGASICLTYSPGADSTDPAINTTHWVQVLREKPQSADGMTYGNCTVEPGYCYHIDNINPTPNGVDPFYDSTFYASGSSFSDRPFHDIATGYDWQFQVFLATATAASPTGRTLTVWDGVWWGFSTPEPASLAMLAVGAGLLGFRRKLH